MGSLGEDDAPRLTVRGLFPGHTAAGPLFLGGLRKRCGEERV